MCTGCVQLINVLDETRATVSFQIDLHDLLNPFVCSELRRFRDHYQLSLNFFCLHFLIVPTKLPRVRTSCPAKWTSFPCRQLSVVLQIITISDLSSASPVFFFRFCQHRQDFSWRHIGIPHTYRRVQPCRLRNLQYRATMG